MIAITLARQMLPGLGWRVSGSLSWICCALNVWFRLSRAKTDGDWAHSSVCVPPSSGARLQLAFGRPVPAAGLPQYSWSFFALLRVGEGGTASARAPPFSLHWLCL